MLFLSLLVSIGKLHAHNLNDDVDECVVQLNKKGKLDLTRTLYGCSENMTDPRMPYSFINETFVTVVRTQLEMNNFYDINEIDGIVTIDLTLRLTWVDPRWDIPELWDPDNGYLQYVS